MTYFLDFFLFLFKLWFDRFHIYSVSSFHLPTHPLCFLFPSFFFYTLSLSLCASLTTFTFPLSVYASFPPVFSSTRSRFPFMLPFPHYPLLQVPTFPLCFLFTFFYPPTCSHFPSMLSFPHFPLLLKFQLSTYAPFFILFPFFTFPLSHNAFFSKFPYYRFPLFYHLSPPNLVPSFSYSESQ